jgi:hypothetical protein
MPDPTVDFLPLGRAASLLARLGFELVHGERAAVPGGAHLVVALRQPPTLQHFDPERVEYWVSTAGRGRHTEVDRDTSLPFEGPFAWGSIDVKDRLEVSNTFLTFGGMVTAQAIDPATTIVQLASTAPILRWSGHSQDVDPFAAEVAAFFARVRPAINFTPGAEATFADMPPLALYAAVVADLRRRYARSSALQEAHPAINQLVAREMRWLESSAPDACDAGHRLLRDLGFERAVP